MLAATMAILRRTASGPRHGGASAVPCGPVPDAPRARRPAPRRVASAGAALSSEASHHASAQLIGILQIRLLEGFDLVAKDIDGLSGPCSDAGAAGAAAAPAPLSGPRADPYVLFSLGGRTVKSKTRYNTLSPKWNQSLELCVPSFHEPLYVRVMDKDRIGADDFMGDVYIPLASLQDGKQQRVRDTATAHARNSATWRS